MDNSYEMFKQEVQGQNGTAIFNEESKEIITGFLGGTLNKYNMFSGISADMLADEKLVNSIAVFLSSAVERDMNEKFHNSLNLLEKNGIITNEKFEMHRKSVERAKFGTSLGVYAAFMITPIICECCNNFIQKKNMQDFLIGSYAYINREQNLMIMKSIEQVLYEMNISLSWKKISDIFNSYVSMGNINKLPTLSRKNRDRIENEQIEILGKKIVSQCDLNDNEIRKRACEFLEDLLHISNAQSEQMIRDATNSQVFLSDFTWFSSLSYSYLFCDFINGMDNALQFSRYDIENDIYHKMREERKEKMQGVIADVNNIDSLFMTAKKRKDIIETSAKLMQYSLNPEYDIATDVRMLKREKKVLELYGL